MTTGAHFKVNQAANSSPTGTDDLARLDIYLSQAIHLVGDSSSGQASPSFTILAWPDGSSRIQASSSSSFDATYTPDAIGPYLVEFLVGDGVGVNKIRRVFAVTKTSGGITIDGGIREPAFGEQEGDDNAGSNDRGYAKAYEVATTKGSLTVATIAALRLTTASRFKRAHVLAYSAAGDGGGGTFVWDASSTVSDDGYDTITPTGLATGRWVRQRPDRLSARHAGLQGDGTTNDSTAAARITGGQNQIFFPNGTYPVDGLTFATAGINLVGQSKTGTILQLRSAQSALLSLSAADISVENLTLDGNLLPTVSVLRFLPGAKRIEFSHCIVKGATADTTDLIAVPWNGSDTTPLTALSFFKCTIQQNPSNTAVNAREAVYAAHPYSRLCFEECYVANASNLFYWGHGTIDQSSIDVIRCTVGKATVAIANIAGVCGASHLIRVVSDQTQSSSVYALYANPGAVAGSSGKTVRVEDWEYANGGGECVRWNFAQPFRLEGCAFGGSDINLTPDATYGTRRARIAYNTFLTTAKGFLGAYASLPTFEGNFNSADGAILP